MQSNMSYESMRYGFFVHYIAPSTFYKDGTIVTDPNEAANNFNVEQFVEDISSMKLEYVIFTAWHYLMVPLYPSEVTRKLRPEYYVERDVIGQMIDGLRERGIKVILYTHPRDGHDFLPYDKVRCGWSEKNMDGTSDTPDFDTFDYNKWNSYVLDLYKELMERYANRIDGIWLDGMGPGKFVFGIHRSYSYEYPIVDYVALRKIIKSANPDIAIIHNGYGYQFTADFIMPESFFDFERTHKDTGDWPACHKAMALCFTEGGWSCSGKYGKTRAYIDREGLLRYMIFQMTSATSGGICLAAGPYCGGGWDVDVMDYMTYYGKEISRLGQSLKNVIPSTSWPTNSGDTLNKRNYVFTCSSKDGEYEYVHVMKMPSDGIIHLERPQDGAKLSYPTPMTRGITVDGFTQTEDGVTFKLCGEPDKLDTVIRFKRENNPNAPRWEWINESDKRIRYRDPELWYYDCLKTVDGTRELTHYIGCYEDDTRIAYTAGARFDTYFECDEIELICCTGPRGGKCDVLIDDICVATVSTHSEEEKVCQTVFSSGKLYGGVHTFSVVLKDGELEFDAIRIKLVQG